MRISLSGGGSSCLAYFSLAKELTEKGLYPQLEEISSASGGAIFAGLLAQHLPPEEIKKFFLDMPGDDCMVLADRIEKNEFNPIEKVFRIIELYLKIQFTMYLPLTRLFKKYYSWDRCKTKLYVAVLPLVEVEKMLLDRGVVLNKFKSLDTLNLDWGVYNPFKTYPHMDPYFLSDDGIYKFQVYDPDRRTGAFFKVSNQVVPMHDAIYSSCYNPILPARWVTVFSHKTVLLDGGMSNNYGNLPFFGKTYTQVACYRTEPPEVDRSSAYPDMWNDFYYHFNRAPKGEFWVLLPLEKEGGFFSFDNERVEKEFSCVSSNILH